MHAVNESQARQAMQAALASIWMDRPASEAVDAELVMDTFTKKLSDTVYRGSSRRPLIGRATV